MSDSSWTIAGLMGNHTAVERVVRLSAEPQSRSPDQCHTKEMSAGNAE